MGTCKYCGQNAGFMRRQHGHCRDLHSTGIQEMTQLAVQASGSPGFSEVALRQTLRAIAGRAHGTEDDVSQAIAAGWAQGVQHAMSNGIITQEEENQLRHFRDRLISGDDRWRGLGQRFLRRLPSLRWPQAALLGPPGAGHQRPACPLPPGPPAGPVG